MAVSFIYRSLVEIFISTSIPSGCGVQTVTTASSATPTKVQTTSSSSDLVIATPPVFSFDGGTYFNSETVTLTSATAGAANGVQVLGIFGESEEKKIDTVGP